VGNPFIRALALRAARFGKTWKTHRGVPGADPKLPEDPARVVENVAWFVLQALQPKGAPAELYLTHENAMNIFRREYGFDRPPPRAKRTSLDDPTFICQEHALLFGSLLRALGFAVRDVNVMQYYPFEGSWQDASSQVWHEGKWNYWGLFDYLPPYAPFRDLHEYYGRWLGTYTAYVGIRRMDPTEHEAISRFNIGDGKVFPALRTWRQSGLWARKDAMARLPDGTEIVFIVMHSPVVAMLELPDGRRVGLNRGIEGEPDRWFWSDDRPGLVNEVPGAIYYPEGLSIHPMNAAAKAGVTPQRLSVPLPDGTRLEDVRLTLTATGKGPYTVEMTHVSKHAGIQRHDPRRGTVTEGDVLALPLSEFVPAGLPEALPDGWWHSVPAPSERGPAFLGVSTHAIDAVLAESVNGPAGHGILVGYVVPGSAAAAAGLRCFDVITQVGGRPVAERSDLQAVLREMRAGQEVSLDVVRLGRIQVTLGQRPASILDDSLPQKLVRAESMAELQQNLAAHWSRGYRLSSIAGRPDGWISVLSPGPVDELQAWYATTSYEEVLKQLKRRWSAGWEAQDLAHNGQEWVALFRKRRHRRGQAVLSRKKRTDLYEEIQQRWKDGYDVTGLARGKTNWVALFTKEPIPSARGFGKSPRPSTPRSCPARYPCSASLRFSPRWRPHEVRPSISTATSGLCSRTNAFSATGPTRKPAKPVSGSISGLPRSKPRRWSPTDPKPAGCSPALAVWTPTRSCRRQK